MDARAQPEPVRPRDTTVRVLVAFEDARGAYGEAITRALGSLRPALEARRAPSPVSGASCVASTRTGWFAAEPATGTLVGGGLGAGAHR
jgi:hypothetical protein